MILPLGERKILRVWDAISRYVCTTLQGMAIMCNCTNDERMTIACYNDGTKLVIFKIERFDIPESGEEIQWLAKQNFKNTAKDTCACCSENCCRDHETKDSAAISYQQLKSAQTLNRVVLFPPQNVYDVIVSVTLNNSFEEISR